MWTQVWNTQEKIMISPTEVKPLTFQVPFGYSTLYSGTCKIDSYGDLTIFIFWVSTLYSTLQTPKLIRFLSAKYSVNWSIMYIPYP